MSENRVPSGVPTGGQFATSARAEADVVLGTPPPPPLTPRDVEILTENKGRFVNGYTPEDADKVLSMFESCHMTVIWDYHDDYGLGGASQFYGAPKRSMSTGTYGEGRAISNQGHWPDYREVHPAVWEYLSDPETDLDPERIPSLLDKEPANLNVGEIYTFSIGAGEQYAWADETGPVCEVCGEKTTEKDQHGTVMCADCQDDEESEEGSELQFEFQAPGSSSTFEVRTLDDGR